MANFEQGEAAMSESPLITIGMPVYNCESTIAESIASILNQTFEDWELIVLDDGSRDDTMAIARQFDDPRIRFVNGGRNRGLPACLNTIVANCKTPLFARMDGDDIAYPRRFEKQLAALERNPEVDLLGGSILIFDGTGDARGFRRAAVTHAEICGRPWRIANLVHVTWIGRATWFLKHPYNEWATHAQDRDLLIRSRRESRFAALPDTLAGVREARPLWSKLLPARKQMLKTAIQEGARQRDPGLLFGTAAAEILKCGLDFVATSTGLDHRLLRHRIPPVSPDRVEEWRNVLESTRARVLEEIGVDLAIAS